MLAHRLSLSPIFCVAFFILWCFHCTLPASAIITNRTIDDSLGDLVTGQKVIYQPADIWQTFNYSFASGGTFTRAQSTGNISATFTFNGTAIYVFFMIPSEAFPHDIPFATSFSLDNGPPQLFQPSPDLNSPLSDVDELVFSITNLVATQHTLIISASPSEGVSHIIDFDYAIYEHDDEGVSSTVAPSVVQSQLPSPSPLPSSQAIPPTGMVWENSEQQSPSTSSGSGMMVACIVIIAALIVGGLALTIFLHRRRKFRKHLPKIEIDPVEDMDPENTSENIPETLGGVASINPFDDSHAAGPTAPRVTNVLGLPPTIYSNGNAYSGTPISSLSGMARPGHQIPGQTARGMRGVPLQPLRIVNRASSTIPSATTATEDFSQQRILEEQLGTYLAMMQQKADEISLAAEGDINTGGSAEETYGNLGYSQEKVKEKEEKSDDEDIDAWINRMSNPDVGVQELKDMIYKMKLQIEALQAQRGVDQTSSPFEDPPPLYTPAIPASGKKGMTNAPGVSKDSPISPTVVDRWRSAVARFSRIAIRANQ